MPVVTCQATFEKHRHENYSGYRNAVMSAAKKAVGKPIYDTTCDRMGKVVNVFRNKEGDVLLAVKY